MSSAWLVGSVRHFFLLSGASLVTVTLFLPLHFFLILIFYFLLGYRPRDIPWNALGSMLRSLAVVAFRGSDVRVVGSSCFPFSLFCCMCMKE